MWCACWDIPLHLVLIETLIVLAFCFFIREDIPTKIINITPLKDFEGIFVKLNFCKKKIILCSSYNPHKNLTSNHLNISRKIMDAQMQMYDNFLIVGDFNSEMTESTIGNFC